MVRSPARSCPNLSRLFDDGEAELLMAFLKSKSFEKLKWLAPYRFEPDEPEACAKAAGMLQREKKVLLGALETEAARIVTIAGSRGQYVLEGMSKSKLEPERARVLLTQRNQLARSLWAYAHEHGLFEAVDSSLHMRLYRRYDTHYQTFMAEPSDEAGTDAVSDILDTLLDELNEHFDRGDGYSIDSFDIPAEGDEPAAEMYLLFHPDPPTSVREIDDAGNRSNIYYRPPGEAMIVYTPSTGRVHVRAGTRKLRHAIAERFIATVLDQNFSSQPVEPPRVYRRVDHSNDEPHDDETLHPRLSGRAA